MDKYIIIKSDRKTAAIQIKEGVVTLRVPKRMTDGQIKEFAEKHSDWIKKQLEKQIRELEAVEEVKPLSKEQLKELADRAKREIPPRVEYYARLLNVTYGRISVKNQKTRWGSCSSKGNLNFNYLLMLAPKEVLDSVIVHELCHRREMNHSDRFYSLVLGVFPDYYEHHQWLKDNSAKLHKLASHL